MGGKYDLIVIGAGPGGYVAANAAAKAGMRVAIAERRDVGGTCLNRGCIPTKAMLHTAHLIRECRDFEQIGIGLAQPPSVYYSQIHERKNKVIETLCGGIKQLFKTNKVELFNAGATIVSKNKVKISLPDGRADMLEGDKILIASGSAPLVPPIPGIDLPGVLTSDRLLGKDGAAINPKSMVIIGGGVIGVEFSDIFSALGCEVTVIEAMNRILPTLDREISQNMSMILKKRGVAINSGAKVTEITKSGDRLAVHFEKNGENSEVCCECVLVAIGRRAVTDGLFTEGFALDTERGAICVNDKFQTSEDNIYAIGDVISGGVQLAHVASAQAENVISFISGGAAVKDLSVVPSCIYTSPEIASAGLDADCAKQHGIAVKVGKAIMSANGRSIISNQERGFIKLVFNAETDVIIGAQMMCARATDMIGEFTSSIHSGLTLGQIRAADVRAHPTYNEAVADALENVR